MRSIQYDLPISQPSRSLTPEEKIDRRKHTLIKGRPRRLAPMSLVVKIGVRPEVVPIVDRIRERMMPKATRPEAIRSIVDEMLESPPQLVDDGKPAKKKGRCEYWKVPLSPEALRGIDELAVSLGWVTKSGKPHRQKVVTLAVQEMIKRYVNNGHKARIDKGVTFL